MVPASATAQLIDLFYFILFLYLFKKGMVALNDVLLILKKKKKPNFCGSQLEATRNLKPLELEATRNYTH